MRKSRHNNWVASAKPQPINIGDSIWTPGLRLQALLREQVPHWEQGLCESPRIEQRMSPGPSCSQLHDAGSQRHPLSALQPATGWRVEAVVPRRQQSLEKKIKLQTLTVRCLARHSSDWSHSIKPQMSSPIGAYRDSSLLFSNSSLNVSGQRGPNRKDRFKTKQKSRKESGEGRRMKSLRNTHSYFNFSPWSCWCAFNENKHSENKKILEIKAEIQNM